MYILGNYEVGQDIIPVPLSIRVSNKVLSSNGSVVSLVLSPSGELTVVSDSGTVSYPSEWASPRKVGIGESYEVRMTSVDGNTTAGDPLDVWLSLGQARSWSVQSSGLQEEFEGTLEIRSAEGGAAITTASITMISEGEIPVIVALSNHSLVSTTVPATLTVSANGELALTENGVTTVVTGEWADIVQPGLGNDYEVRMTTTSGTLSSGTTGVWLPITENRSWSVESNPFSMEFTGTLEIRPTGGSVVATAAISMESEGLPALAFLLTDHTVSSSVGSASITLNRNGSLAIVEDGVETFPAGEWATPLIPDLGDNYEVRMTAVSGTVSSGTLGSWQSLNVPRSWTVSTTPYTKQFVGTLQIREVGSGTVVESATIGLEAVGITPSAITISNHTVNSSLQPATLTLETGGQLRVVSNGSSTAISGEWSNPLIAGLGNDYEVRMTTSSGSLSSGTVGSWISLSTNRSWTVDASSDLLSKSYVGTIEIRPVGGSVVDTGIISLNSSGPTIALSNKTLSGEETKVGIKLTSIGQCIIYDGAETPVSGEWATPTHASVGTYYEARLTLVTGSTATGSSSVGAWLALSSDREWFVDSSVTNLDEGFTGTLEIRRVGGSVVASATINATSLLSPYVGKMTLASNNTSGISTLFFNVAGAYTREFTVNPTGIGTDTAWSPDGRYVGFTLSLTSGGQFCFIYDMDSGSPVSIGALPGISGDTAYSIAWSPDGVYLAVASYVASIGSSSGIIGLWKWNNGAPTKVGDLSYSLGIATKLAWSPNSRYLAVAGNSSPHAAVYDFETGTAVPETLVAAGARLWGVSWSADSQYVTFIGRTSATRMVTYDALDNFAMQSPPAELTGTAGGMAVWHPVYKGLAWAPLANNATVLLIDYTTGVPVVVNTFSRGSSTFRPCGGAFTPDGTRLAVLSESTQGVHICEYNSVTRSLTYSNNTSPGYSLTQAVGGIAFKPV